MTDANWCSLFTDPQHHGSTPKGTPLNFRHNRGKVLKKNCTKALSLKCGKIGPKSLLRTQACC